MSSKPRPFRLTAPVAAEQLLHEAVARLLDVLLLPGVEWTTFPAGNVPLAPRDAAKLARLGLKRGWPDIMILHDRQLFGIELKRHGGRLSATRAVRTRRGSLRQIEGQQDVFPRLEAAGMHLAVCRSVDEVLAQLRAWDLPMRQAAA